MAVVVSHEPAIRRAQPESGRPAPPILDLAVPVYNEVRALAPSITVLHDYLTKRFPWTWRLTVVDNGSNDGTWEEACQLAARLDGVEALHLEARGRGRALRAAWSVSNAAVVAYTDVDLSTDLDALLPLVAPLIVGHSHLAIGSRLAAGARVERPLGRELVSRVYNRLLHLVFGNRFRDAQCGFKAIRTDVAHRLLPEIRDNGWFFDTELLLLAERNGLRVTEISVDWIDNADSRVAVVRTALDDLRGVARMARQFWTGRGRLDLGQFERAPVPANTSGQLLSFATIGVVSTAAYLLLFLALRSKLGALAANAVSLTATAVANTAAHRRWTFGLSGRRGRTRDWGRATVVHIVGLAVTSAAVEGAAALDGGTTSTQLLLLGLASVVASTVRLLLMPGWVFGGGGQ